ncbi:MAG: proline--tRNA ligase [Ignavibacteria bacterium]
MKLSHFFLPTLKEDPSDAVIPSHKLMVRSGMIRQLTSGVYSYLPLGLIVFKKIENIIREEMNAIGGVEFLLPALSPLELWEETGRSEHYGDAMFRISNRPLVLAPTHEEVFTSIAKPNLISYKDLPQIWYQIQTKFRNEPRPRSGVLRSRQFTMKDAYSFDESFEGLDESYNKIAQAYENILSRCGLKSFTVKAFSGAMGGSQSEEFMVESKAGEDNVILSDDNRYAANLEVAVSYKEKVERKNSNLKLEEFLTPNVKTIDELAGFLKIKDKSRLAKSRVFVIPEVNETESKKYILVLLCGDDEVNESKLKNLLGMNVFAAETEELFNVCGADAGSIGPINSQNKFFRVIADLRLQEADELISGANKNDYHIKNIDLKRDVQNIEYYDLRIVKEGELTSDKKSKIRITKAIEVGHIFKLGTIYAESLGAKFLDKNGSEKILVMGSYGIGIERIAAAYIEQNNDENGIIWDGEIGPFHIHIICINVKSQTVKEFSDKLYIDLLRNKYEVLYDDRDNISPGFKFKDADLIGIPFQLIVSEKNVKNDEVELKIRRTNQRHKIKTSDIIKRLSFFIKKSNIVP